MHRRWSAWPAIAWLLLLSPLAAGAQQPPDTTGPVVRGILFYSPSCPHCRDVLTEGLPPLLDRYGSRLQVAGVNTATSAGQQLYRATVEHFALPRERTGVPTLLVGEQVLVGSVEIPTRLPAIVDSALAVDGIDWPPVPLIRQALAASPPPEPRTEAPAAEQTPRTEAPAAEQTPQPDATAAEETPQPRADPAAAEGTPQPSAAAAEQAPQPRAEADDAGAPGDAAAADGHGDAAGGDPGAPPGPGPGESAGAAEAAEAAALAEAITPDARQVVHEESAWDRVMRDPAGNGTAVAVLVLMVAALGLVLADVRGAAFRIPRPPEWLIPLLALVGLGVAAYLAFVEVTGAEAVCGPVGDCNTVQQSPYARLFGLVPVGLLGVAGYLLLLGAWAGARFGPDGVARTSGRLVWALALVAVGFSLYLTFLEPFVIGASCAWCLSSAIIATLILLAATPGRRASA